MKITRIEISGVLGLLRADIDTTKPITLIAGANEAGKSTLADAVSMAILGTPKRVKLKKELAQLLHEGCDKGRISVLGEDEAIGEFKLPGGQHVVMPGIVGEQFLEYVLDPSLFARKTPDERRSLLFQLTKCRARPDDTEKMLIAAGVDPLLAAEIKPSLRSGFPGACKEAKERATEYKGVWRGITGETWGSDKANGWAPAVPDVQVDQQQIDDAKAQADLLEVEIGEAQQTLGEVRAKAKAAADAQGEIERLTTEHGLLERRRNKLAIDEQELAKWQAKLEEAEQAASGTPKHDALTCPHCQGTVAMIGGQLQSYELPETAPDLEAGKRAGEYRGYVQSAERAIANGRRDIAASEAAGVRLEELRKQKDETVSQEAIDNAHQLIVELKQHRDQHLAKYNALSDAMREITGREQRIQQAAAAHKNVMAWLAMADELSPEGIPARILSSAIQPVNDSLELLSNMAGWKKVVIGQDMEITCAGRLYGLMSESAKWRADVLIALAIAQISELRLIVIDRFDVLDADSRQQLLGMLIKLAKADAMDNMIMCGTMKELPAKLPDSVHGVWIANAIAES